MGMAQNGEIVSEYQGANSLLPSASAPALTSSAPKRSPMSTDASVWTRSFGAPTNVEPLAPTDWHVDDVDMHPDAVQKRRDRFYANRPGGPGVRFEKPEYEFIRR